MDKNLKTMKNRIFSCNLKNKEIRVVVDPIGVMLTPLYTTNLDYNNFKFIKYE